MKLMILTAAFISCSAFAQEHDAACFKERTEVINGETRIIGETVPCAPGKQKTVEQIEREETAALKRKCGKDYMALRIGMKITRLEECLGAIYDTETVSQTGVVKTYRTTHDWVYVQNGVVTGYTKRTD